LKLLLREKLVFHQKLAKIAEDFDHNLNVGGKELLTL
jgi:hypothetical protein